MSKEDIEERLKNRNNVYRQRRRTSKAPQGSKINHLEERINQLHVGMQNQLQSIQTNINKIDSVSNTHDRVLQNMQMDLNQNVKPAMAQLQQDVSDILQYLFGPDTEDTEVEQIDNLNLDDEEEND